MNNQSMTIKITNDSSRVSAVVLEPWGECQPIGPGESKLVRRSGGEGENISIDIGENEIKVWEEGSGVLEFS